MAEWLENIAAPFWKNLSSESLDHLLETKLPDFSQEFRLLERFF